MRLPASAEAEQTCTKAPQEARWGRAMVPPARAVICYVDMTPRDGVPVERRVVGSILPAAALLLRPR
jgi:hypothetical protein